MPKLIVKQIKLGARWFAIALFLFAIFSLLTVAPASQPQESNSIKGVWISHVGNAFLTYTSLTDNVFHQLSSLNYNRVYVDVAIGLYAGSLINQKPLIEIQQQIAIAKKYGYGYAIFTWETALSFVRKDKQKQKELYLKAI